MAIFTRHQPTSIHPKLMYFIENKDNLHHMRTLLSLFSVSEKPCFTFPEDMYGAALLTAEFDHYYDAAPYINAKVMHVAVRPSKPTPLSWMESDRTSPDTPIHISLPNKDRGIYTIGQFVESPNGELFTVSRIRKYRRLGDHPHLNELSEAEKKRIGTYPYEVVSCTRYEEGVNTLPSSSQATYAVAMVEHRTQDGMDPSYAPVKLGFILLSADSTVAPYHIYDRFLISKGMIENYTKKKPEQTTFGLFLLNQVVLVKAFGDKIPYINSAEGTSEFAPSRVDDAMAQLIRDRVVGREGYNTCMDMGYFLGHITQLWVPGLSRKSLVTDPRIKKRAEELFKEHEDHLNDPIVTTKIEQELINMDKEWIRGDSSERYYAVNPGKSYDEHRKKMFLTMGVAPSFVKGAASYDFIKSSLADGWQQKDLPPIANEIRRGSHDRGVGTAKGGEQTKFIIRLLATTKIQESDCGSKKGNLVTITDKNVKMYYGRHLITAPNKTTVISKDNAASFIGKQMVMRSPQYCGTQHGLCFTCCGEYFRTLDSRYIGILAVQIGSKFTSLNMKSMHFSGVKNVQISDISRYLIF